MTRGSRSNDASQTFVLEESSIAEIERAVRDADPWAFPVPSRIVRRAIRHEADLPGLTARVPHRKSFVLTASRARQIVESDELGINDDGVWPERVILLARPEDHELEEMTDRALREHYRRLHFHARLHVAHAALRAGRGLDLETIEGRIEQIGRTAFEEIRSVLRHEAFLIPPVTESSVYTEFVALFLEFRYFEPELIPVYFPSLDDIARIEGIVGKDLDPSAILRMSADLAGDDDVEENGDPSDVDAIVEPPRPRRPHTRLALVRAKRLAEAAAGKGNDVRAAILHTRISASSDDAFAQSAAASAAEDIDRLAARLQKSLGLEGDLFDAWRELLAALLPQSAYGFWNTAARLLYDLQKVCIDFERTTYVVDLGAWLRSLGRRPLKRELPAQREVRMSKHLRSAMARLAKVRLPEGQRERFGLFLSEASDAAEQRLRDRLRPLIESTVFEVGFCPQNVPERVALGKIVEELLDAVVVRGFLGMSDIRDAIARNDLKLDDVADLSELVVGDRLLRADRRLAEVLDGVYVRGAFYLRWLQRLSSLAFGTRPGRFLTLYGVIPFGGAFVLLSGLDHLIHAVDRFLNGDATPLPSHVGGLHSIPEVPPPPIKLENVQDILLVGLFLLALIHHDRFRGLAWKGMRMAGHGMRQLFVDFPLWLAEATLVRRILQSAPVVFFRRRLLTALLLTLLAGVIFPWLGWYTAPTNTGRILMFVAFAIVLNSRAGRDIEELATERLQRIWHRIRVHVFVALFDLVMDSFKRLLEWVERILYEVDEWLRFQSGENRITLAIKAVLGLIWSIVRFFLRFFVTVLIEPQINPIKHFPVVTVSHKVILPLGIPLSKSLVPVFGAVRANFIATTSVFLAPGIFGFLVWELRANWRLYAVNRHRSLTIVGIGSHGETMLRLMKPGIHSGTLPRLYSRLRRSARHAPRGLRMFRLAGYYSKLRHVEIEVRRFFEREVVSFLSQSSAFREVSVEIGAIELNTNSVRIELQLPQVGDDSLWIAYEHHHARLTAGIWKAGVIARLTKAQRATLAGLLVGLDRMLGVDLLREQVEPQLASRNLTYEVTEAGLAIRPARGRAAHAEHDRDATVLIPWNEGPPTRPPHIPPPETLIFRRTSTLWDDWVSAWTQEESGELFPDLPPLHPSSVALPGGN